MAQAKSPDGRVWEIQSVRERVSLEGSGSVGSVVLTFILVVMIIVLPIWSPVWAILGGGVRLIRLTQHAHNHSPTSRNRRRPGRPRSADPHPH